MTEGDVWTDRHSGIAGTVRYSPGMTDPDRPTFARDIHLDTLSDGALYQQQLPAHWRAGAADLAYCISATDHEPTRLHIHVHEGMELGMVLSGREQQQFGNVAFNRLPGDVWLCPLWEPHAWRVEAAQTKKVVLIFLPEFLGDDAVGNVPYLDLFRLPPDRRPEATSGEVRARLLSVGCEMAREIEKKQAHWQNVVRLYVLLILAELVRLHEQSAPSEAKAATQVHHTQLTRIIPAVRLVQTCPWGRLSTTEAAAACALSPSHFSHLFRSAMGISFGSFTQRARLTFAVQRLLYTRQTVREIADAANFVDSSHFHRTFVQHYGCSPGTYRARAR